MNPEEKARYTTLIDLIRYAAKTPIDQRPDHLKDLEAWIKDYKKRNYEWMRKFN